MEYGIFNNLISSEKFDKLSTSEKIKICLAKDIFICGNIWQRDKFNCFDLDSINLKSLNKTKFSVTKTYKIDGVAIRKNPLFEEEIVNALCNTVELNPLTTFKEDEILFRLNFLTTKDAKVIFLQSKIENYNAFSLETLMVKFFQNGNKLEIYHDSKIEILNSTSKFQLDWVFGNQYYGDAFFLNKDNFIEGFFQDYQKIHLTNFCLQQIQFLQNETTPQFVEKKDNNHNFTTYQLSYLMSEIGVVKAMQQDGLSNLEIAKTIGRIISRSPQNIRTYLREIITTSDSNLSAVKKSAQEEISKFLKYFKNLE